MIKFVFNKTGIFYRNVQSLQNSLFPTTLTQSSNCRQRGRGSITLVRASNKTESEYIHDGRDGIPHHVVNVLTYLSCFPSPRQLAALSKTSWFEGGRFGLAFWTGMTLFRLAGSISKSIYRTDSNNRLDSISSLTHIRA